MLKSMTGFGRGTARAGTTEATVEVRAVNGRFAEVAVRAPRVLNPHEAAIQTRCKEALERGSISVSIALLRAGADLPLRVNAPAARAYAQLLRVLREEASLDGPVTLDHLLRYPDVLSSEGGDDETASADAWAAAEAALAEALTRLDAMRVEEGARLADDLQKRLGLIEEHLVVVEARAPARVVEAQTRLRDRLSELLADERLNPDRLETEIALLADRLDVT
ncbi:MAG TPA: YicC/YloC family endoribonuclease, partial [Rubricoccaceae bacterium]|nr:YicC/YloC family endoribonuclease [Rubricoccaceae bacterium]